MHLKAVSDRGFLKWNSIFFILREMHKIETLTFEKEKQFINLNRKKKKEGNLTLISPTTNVLFVVSLF